jgi:hypothetical protein
VATISFVILAGRSIEFFDPAQLTRVAVGEITRWALLASRKGLHWREPSFQGHYQRQAEASVRVLDLLADFVVEKGKSVRTSALRDVCRDTLAALLKYADVKTQIPPKSLWFRRAPVHKDWLMADSSAVGLALATSTAIDPDLVPDPGWLESDVSDVLARVLRAAIERRERANMLAMGQSVSWALQRLASRSTTEAQSLLRRLAPLMLSWVEEDQKQSDTRDTASDLAVCEASALCLLGVLLGTFDGIRKGASFLVAAQGTPRIAPEGGLQDLPRLVQEEAESI